MAFQLKANTATKWQYILAQWHRLGKELLISYLRLQKSYISYTINCKMCFEIVFKKLNIDNRLNGWFFN